MRHKRVFRKLGRTMEHRKSLHRNLAQSLFEHGQVKTTLQKAKDLQPFVERLITLARKAGAGNLGARRRIHRMMAERYLIPKEHQEAYEGMSLAERRAVRQSRSGRRHRTGQTKGAESFTSQAVSHRLITQIAPRYADRPGGYTRVVRLSQVRVGDAGEQAIIQLVGEESTPSAVPRAGKSARDRRIEARYAAVKKGSRAPKTRTAGDSGTSAADPGAGAGS